MSRRSRHLRLFAAVAGFLLAACTAPSTPSTSAIPPGAWRSFEGTWTATGERRALEAPPEQSAVVLDLSGSILLVGERGIGAGFQARVIAYSDGATMVGRAVWTDDQGDRIFSTVRGQPMAAGRRISGTFTGGTGRWAGIDGEYVSDWTYLVRADDGRVSGRSEVLKGRARILGAEAGRR